MCGLVICADTYFFKEEVLAFVGGGLDQAFYRSSELEFVSSRLR